MEATQQPDAEDGVLNCLQDKRAFPASDLERYATASCKDELQIISRIMQESFNENKSLRH